MKEKSNMAENVQWIRLKVGMFDGNSFKKIKRAKIGGVSYRDKLTAVWFELLDLAGKSNANGYLIDNNEIPYQTFEDIATMLDREEKEIELCMQFFINERMVEIVDDIYCLTNFMMYQNQEGLEKIREQKRIAQAKWRDKKKEAILGNVSEYDICSYCGEKADTVDHIIPRAKGGKDILSNLTPACKRCNCTKNSWDLLVFLNDPFSDFVKKELVLSNPKFNVTYNEETKKYEYVDIYKTSTDNLLSNSISTSNSKSNSNSIYEKEFEEIWSIYPNKQGKSKALKSYIKARKDGIECETIRDGVERYSAYCKANATDKQYISHGDTWFGNRRWTDEYEMKGDTNADNMGNNSRSTSEVFIGDGRF